MAWECPDREEYPVEEARVERDERAVREQVLEELGVGAQLVLLELAEVGLAALVQRDELRARDLDCVIQERLVIVAMT